MREKLPVTHRKILDKIARYANLAPEGAEAIAPHATIRLLRGALRMTQAQLAKRVGLPQSHIAKIESGKVDLQLSTLRKIFEALFCKLLILPKSLRKFDAVIADQIDKAAIKRVSRVMGTMALEKQRPGGSASEDLTKAEKEKLKRSLTSEIWED